MFSPQIITSRKCTQNPSITLPGYLWESVHVGKQVFGDLNKTCTYQIATN